MDNARHNGLAEIAAISAALLVATTQERNGQNGGNGAAKSDRAKKAVSNWKQTARAEGLRNE
jgi:hypothetical protein